MAQSPAPSSPIAPRTLAPIRLATPKVKPTFASTITLPPPTLPATRSPASSPTPTVLVTTIPGEAQIPALLYHHIGHAPAGQESLFITPAAFQEQMTRLRDWGYSPLRVSDAFQALREGKMLPLRPVLITFDDGNQDIYQNAFPILAELGYPATVYIITKTVGADTQLSGDMIRNLTAAGWEIGSHSATHANLLTTDRLREEICYSKLDLEEISNQRVLTFAYPYGLADSYVMQFARDCGYTSGAGLGPETHQKLAEAYYFPRLPVLGSWSIEEFSAHLPWRNP